MRLGLVPAGKCVEVILHCILVDHGELEVVLGLEENVLQLLVDTLVRRLLLGEEGVTPGRLVSRVQRLRIIVRLHVPLQ